MGVCEPWFSEADLCSPCNDYEVLGPIAADLDMAASDLVYEWSGRQFPGECEAVVRPEVRCRGASWSLRSRRSGLCCSEGHHTIDIGAFPVIDVTEVKVDGVVLDPSLYGLKNRRQLVRRPDPDGSNPGWPTVNRLDLPDTEEGTFSLAYTWGELPGPMGVRAAAVLACELAMSCDPENQSKCRLPKNATTVNAEGITVVMSPSDFLDKDGKTGIWEVDVFLRAVNPSRSRRRPTVWSPGGSHADRVVY